ncbi:MAG: hypothetical protein R3E32_16880 [Chitinophagales bacterium]
MNNLHQSTKEKRESKNQKQVDVVTSQTTIPSFEEATKTTEEDFHFQVESLKTHELTALKKLEIDFSLLKNMLNS